MTHSLVDAARRVVQDRRLPAKYGKYRWAARGPDHILDGVEVSHRRLRGKLR